MSNRLNRSIIGLIAVFLCTTLLSCKSSREIVRVANLKPLSANRILRNIENNAFDYKEMEMSRIACQFESNGQNISFRGTLKSKKDEAILLSFNKMNVPVGKVLLTPDSVQFINFLNKTYFQNNYTYLSNLLQMDLDFETINSILSNNAFSYKHDNDFLEYTAAVDSGMYVLKTVRDKKLEKAIRKGKDRRLERIMKKVDDMQMLEQSLYIDSNFKLRKVVLDDPQNKRTGIIRFADFMEVGRQNYPGEIELQFISPANKIRLQIKIGKITMEKKQSFNFKIPERYQPVK